MSTTRNSVGPQTRSVYRRRRLVVGLGLVAVLAIILLIIVRPGSGRGEPVAPATPIASAPATPSASATASSQPTPEPTAAAEGAPCTANNVQVEAITDAVNYEPGQLPQLSLSITNTGASSCTINAGTSRQVFTITSGNDVYWTSSDCQKDAADADVLLKPGVPISSAESVPWDRTRSAKNTCDLATRDAASAGGASYHLRVSVDGIESKTPKQFLLY